MLQNGTNINGVMIEKPHRFLTAMTIATQIITAVTSSQYGGATVTMTHLAPFVRDSYNKYLKKYQDRKLPKEQCEKFAKEDLKKEIEDGKMEQYFQKRIENKLIFFDTVSVETVVVKDEFEVTAGAQKRKMRVSVKRSAALTVPEEKIRRKKVLQEIVERDQEE